MNLVGWLKTLPQKDFHREVAIAIKNCERIYKLTGNPVWYGNVLFLQSM